MVNTGKPSKGCYMCRARRIKCDEAKPHCMRCQKSKRECPGYRDIFELNHRDETKANKRKTSRMVDKFDKIYNNQVAINQRPTYWSPGALQSHTTCMPDLGITANVNNHGLSNPRQFSMTQHLSTSLDQQATCYFMANYVLIPKGPEVTTRYLDFLIPLLKEAKPNSALDLTFSAVACAALACRPGSHILRPKIDSLYAPALKAINTSLGDTVKAKEDSTLAAIVLLSTFETIVTDWCGNKANWLTHVDGATALVRARGNDKFNDPVAAEIYISIRAHMAIQCTATATHVLPSVEWWMSGPDEEGPVKQFHYMHLRTAELRADTEDSTNLVARTPANIKRVLKVLNDAHQLDDEYLAWFKTWPEEWLAKPVAYIETVEGNLYDSVVFPGRVDSFEQLYLGTALNMIRSCRLYIWSTVVRCIAWLGEPNDYRLSSEFQNATRISQEIITDTIASMPYFFGWQKDSQTPLHNIADATGGHNIKAAAAIFIIWPLYTACRSDFATDSQRIYMKGRLAAIKATTGMRQPELLVGRTDIRQPSAFIQQVRSSHLELKNSPRTNCMALIGQTLLPQRQTETQLPSPTEDFQNAKTTLTSSPPYMNSNYTTSPSSRFSGVPQDHLSPPLTPKVETWNSAWEWNEQWDSVTNSYHVQHNTPVKSDSYEDVDMDIMTMLNSDFDFSQPFLTV